MQRILSLIFGSSLGARLSSVPQAKGKPYIYQLKITLLESDPLIWRCIEVPSTLLLSGLHDVLQAVMGWTDSHVHQFEKDGKCWRVPDSGRLEEDIEIIAESELPVGELLTAEGDSMIYVYDLADNWRHQIILEKVVPSYVPTKPICVDGARRCPPEDVDGPHGYHDVLDVIFKPGHEESGHHRRRARNPIHAEEFDLGAANEILGRMR